MEFMTPFEARASIKFGTKQAKLIGPLKPTETFRFPDAVRSMREVFGVNSASEYAMEMANVAVTKQEAERWVRCL